jgi:hypothetical protein
MMVVHGMRLLARSHQEATFACLVRALVNQDIEIKAAVLLFINSMIMGIEDHAERSLVRSELNCQLLGEMYQKTLKEVDREVVELRSMGTGKDGMESKLRRRSMVTMFGPRAYDEKKVEALIRNQKAAAVTDFGSIVDAGIKVMTGIGDKFVLVSPTSGTMAGLLTAAKNESGGAGVFRSAFGGKTTKRRWYELDADVFGWYSGHEKDATGGLKGTVAVASITDIRPYTTDAHLAETCPFCFEVETNERVYALGCDSQLDKDNWISALHVARDNQIIAKGAYKLQKKELEPSDVLKFAEMFKKQGAVYHSIAIEDRYSCFLIAVLASLLREKYLFLFLNNNYCHHDHDYCTW